MINATYRVAVSMTVITHDMRSTDGRSYYEGTLDNAINLGWQLNEQGDVLCPHCVNNGMARLFIDDRWNSHEILLNLKMYQQAHDNN